MNITNSFDQREPPVFRIFRKFFRSESVLFPSTRFPIRSDQFRASLPGRLRAPSESTSAARLHRHKESIRSNQRISSKKKRVANHQNYSETMAFLLESRGCAKHRSGLMSAGLSSSCLVRSCSARIGQVHLSRRLHPLIRSECAPCRMPGRLPQSASCPALHLCSGWSGLRMSRRARAARKHPEAGVPEQPAASITRPSLLCSPRT